MAEDKEFKDENGASLTEDDDFDPWADKPWKRWSEEEWESVRWLDDVSDIAAENDQWEYLFLVKGCGKLFGENVSPEQISRIMGARVIGEIHFKDENGKPIQLPENLKCEVIYDDDIAIFIARKKNPEAETAEKK
jgi:hypothetical protein